ncbi:MAG: LytTR family DNA-binding domain-containing protein [Flavobacteriales bacterium]|nr:LytTR family DNA-binding domain-containing protein [Flavobacteriales bacterium]
MTCLIVENELPALEIIKSFIKELYPRIQIVETNNLEAAVMHIKNSNLDLIFLDLELDNEWGFDLFKKMDGYNVPVIITTSFDNYALQAIKCSAVDYLIKPYSLDQLENAMQRAFELNSMRASKGNYDVLVHNLKNPSIQKMVINTSDQVHIIEKNDILYLSSEGSYTAFVMTSGERILASRHMKYYLELFTEANFFRCHRSYLVNVNKVVGINKKESKINLKDGNDIPLAIKKKDELLELLLT